MILFLLGILSLYGALHFYIFSKVQGALALGPLGSTLLIVFMAAMVGAPVMVHISEKRGFEASARLISSIGYMWMALAFLFFSFAFLLDLYRFLLSAWGPLFQRDLSHLALSRKWAFFIPVGIAVAVAFYGYSEARGIRNETLIIKSPKIPTEVSPLRIAQISDVHLGLTVRAERLKRILAVIERAKPDILVSTGDLVDGLTDDRNGLAELLKSIRPRYGKFAVTGNHEFYAGLDQSLRFTEQAGFTLLRGESLTIDGIINIAGVDDPTSRYFGLFRDVSEKDLLSSLPSAKFTLLIKHMPRVDPNARGLFDLQLSGHTHGGQLFPFSLLTRLFFPSKGLVPLSDHSYMYVNRGTGTWGPPIRFLSPPEVTVIELVHEA